MCKGLKIRTAREEDVPVLLNFDRHISADELRASAARGRVLVAEADGRFAGWLRWGLFWDNTPFMNMLFLLEEYRGKGLGKALVAHWEELMRHSGFGLIMTSSLSNESAQHFYRRLGYKDSGALLLKDEPLEIIFTKEI